MSVPLAIFYFLSGVFRGVIEGVVICAILAIIGVFIKLIREALRK